MTLDTLTATLIIPAASWDPFDGLNPSFGPFQALLGSRIQQLLALAWALAFVYLAYRLIMAVTAFGRAKNGKYGADLNDAKSDMGWAAGALVALASVGAIYSALVAF